MLYFNVKKSSGYNLEMIINLKEKTIKRGYCLAVFKSWITLSKTDFNNLYETFINEGFNKIED